MANVGGPAPGWYPDPWAPGGTRWWDGAQWTPHAAPGWGASVAQPQPFDPARAATAARFARIAMVSQAVLSTITCLVTYRVLAAFITNATTTTVDIPGVDLLALNLLSPLTLAITGCLIYWTYRATTDARLLGWHTRLEPALAAAGWIIPVVNLWFPYQAMSDLVAESDRRRVGWWWGLYLGAGFATVLPVLTWFATRSHLAASASALIPIAGAWAAAWIGTSLVSGVLARQLAEPA